MDGRMIRRVFIAAVLAISCGQAANAQLWVKQTGVDNSNPARSSNPVPVGQTTLPTASIVNAAVDIVTTTSTVINLGVLSRKITIRNCDTAAVINVDIKAGTASTSNGVRIDPGIAYTFTPAIGASSFSYYSTAPASAIKTLTYVAE